MFNNQLKEEKEIEAIKLIDRAENLVDKDKGEDAINLYEKAAQLYLDIGSYIKLDELFARIIQIISQFKNNIQASYRLKSIIRKTEELKLNEISAKLLIHLGNLLYNMKDWEKAGESWSKASDYLYEEDPDEFNSLSSILLLKAGQAYERSHLTKDMGKRLILKAVMKINKFDELYQEEEKRAQLLLVNKEFETAADKFYTISTYFAKALENIGDILDEANSKDTMLNAKARFIHFVAEYQTLSAISLTATNNLDFKEKIENLGKESIKRFSESIALLKELLYPKKKDFDKELILRLTFDTMLLAIIQRILDMEEVICTEFLFKNIQDNKALIKNLKNSPYFKLTQKIEKVGLTDTLQDFLKINMGHFERIKNALVSHFLELK